MTTLQWLTTIRGVNKDSLLEVGASIEKGWVMFPILDLYKRPVGSIRRTIKKNWRLSRDFDKRHLYLLCYALPEVIRKGYVVVVEGVFDALILFQAGIRNVCAMFGSDLTRLQQLLLLRFTDTVICLLDGDGKARGSRPMIAMRTYNLITPYGLDPDEYVLKYGTEPLVQFMEGQIDGRGRNSERQLEAIRKRVGRICSG